MRGFLVTVVLAVLVAGAGAWYLEIGPFSKTQEDDGGKKGSLGKIEFTADIGGPLYDIPLQKKIDPPRRSLGSVKAPNPIVIPGHLAVYQKVEVPATREGPIKFLGIPVTSSDPMKPQTTELATIDQGDKVKTIAYKRLNPGDRVLPNQLIGMVDPALAMKDYAKKKIQVEIAKKEAEAIERVKKEAYIQWKRAVDARAEAAEIGLKALTFERQSIELVKTIRAMEQAQAEADLANIVVKMHEIRNPMSGIGIVKHIYKQTGEAVKSLEPVYQLHNIESLRAEGVIEEQYLSFIDSDRVRVTLEPRQVQAPWTPFDKKHRNEITSVAITGYIPFKDLAGKEEKAPWIVSSSIDENVIVWNLFGGTYRELPHGKEVWKVACTPDMADHHWFASGCDDGTIRMWNLDQEEFFTAPSIDPMWEKSAGHLDRVTALAFSPNGEFLASGGEDNKICIWKAKTGELLYQFNPENVDGELHQGAITSLTFTTQGKLISAARDKTIRVWDLHEKGARSSLPIIKGRSGAVSHLGVSKDGQYLLLDKDNSLQVLSVADGSTITTLENHAGAPDFDTLAIFSPDSSLILTAGAPEGRLQLWRSPLDGQRGFEVRQWVTTSRSPVTCAAFSPDYGISEEHSSFAVTGTKDGDLYLWAVPAKRTVEKHLIGNLRINMRDRILDGRQVRIGVNIRNPITPEHPYGKLDPGSAVNIVIEPYGLDAQ